MGAHARGFVQLKSGIESGRTGGPRPPDEDELDLHQAFVDLTAGVRSRTLTLRIGRQEIAFGSSRLVSTREGPNVRQSFDGVRLTTVAFGATLDAFLTLPWTPTAECSTTGRTTHVPSRGVYCSAPLPVTPFEIDVYYLGLDRTGAGARRRARAPSFRGHATLRKPTRMGLQPGRRLSMGYLRRGRIRAWTVASDTGYTFEQSRSVRGSVSRRTSQAATAILGDDDLETFNALFPRGSYFSEAGLIGPANFFDLHPSVALALTAQTRLTVDWDFFWRQSRRDGIYGSAVNLVRSAAESRARTVGNQISVDLSWQVDRHFELHLSYGHFFAGRFLEETGSGRDVDYVSPWATYKF